MSKYKHEIVIMKYLISGLLLLLPVFTAFIRVEANEPSGGYGIDLTELDLEELMDVEIFVSTSTRTPVEANRAPGAVYVITSEEIERLPVFNVADILRLVPGVYVNSTNMGERVTIRGFGQFPFSDKVLFLIDGVPWNSPDKGGSPGLPHWDIFPIEQIKQLEVVRTPGSVLYGKNAFWGTINIVTKNSKDTEGIKAQFLTGERNTNSGYIQYGGDYKDIEWSFLGKSYRQDGPIKVLEDSQEERNEGFLKLRYKDLVGSIYFENYRQEDFRFIGSRRSFDTLGTSENIINVNMEYRKNISERVTSTTRFSLQHRRGTACAVCHFGSLGTDSSEGWWGNRTDVKDDREQDSRFYLSQQVDCDIGKTVIGRHTVSGGVDGWYDIVKRKISETNVLTTVPDAPDDYIDSGGVFLQDQCSLLDDKLNLTLGARLDHHEKSGYAFTKRIALVSQPLERMTFRASFTSAFKAPNWNDMYLHHLTAPGLNFGDTLGLDTLGGGSDLDNESIREYELGIEYRFTPRLTARVDGYYTEVRDLIVSKKISNLTSQYDNSDETGRVKGGELSLDYKFAEGYSLRLGYDYQWTNDFPRNQKDSSGNKIGTAYAPENKVHGMLFTRPLENLDVNMSWFWSDSFWVQSFLYSGSNPQREKSSSYNLLNAKASYKLPQIKKVKPQVFVIGQNLLNEKVNQFTHAHDFRSDSKGTGMVGRRVVIGLEIRF